MYATYVFLRASSICPSLILHGRTEIKARALVLGEVSALSFCLPAILSAKATKTHKVRVAGTGNRSRNRKQEQVKDYRSCVLLVGAARACCSCVLLLPSARACAPAPCY